MRKFISGLLAIAAAAFTGCYESGTDADNTSREARISISPAAIGFDADGRTTDGLAFGTYIVTVNPYGKMYSDWYAELVGTDWATLDYHTASPDGAVEKALRITCSANTDYKRTGTLRLTLSKTGESVDFPITQVGLKPDATLTLSTESDIEMMALEPAEVTVAFETNMPASTVTAELEEGVEWLTCTLDREAGTIVLAASDNTSPTDMREATVTVSAGTEDTSLATRQIKVRQLANETYLFIYGSGIPHFAAFGDAAQMNKNDLVFGLDHYFRSGKVILSTSRTPDAYPRYALTADGKLAVLADAAAEAAAAGELCLGTIDAWVVWTLTGGAEFRCDWSNASRTQLFDLRRGCWSEPVCEAFGVDVACLPQVTDSDGLFGTTDLGGFLPAPVPIHGVLGDSHAALFAQGCHSRGMAKATYGTGSSVMMNVGDEFVASSHGLSSSLAWRMDGVTEYVLEGNVSYAGAVKTWLRDDLELINNPEEVTDLCYAANPASRVYFVPAFTGLGAPHWASDAEGCVFGMTRATGRAEFVKAADESIAYQIFDVIDAMVEDSGAALAELRVDGGPTRDAYLMQFESDLVGSPIRIASNDEMSGLGAAWACGIALGMYARDVVDVYGARGIVEPTMSVDERAKKIAGWRRAVDATIAYTA